jgi:hypothetical protein
MTVQEATPIPADLLKALEQMWRRPCGIGPVQVSAAQAHRRTSRGGRYQGELIAGAHRLSLIT